jgi:two-component system sensor histidine kinase AlgZ
MKKYIKKLKSFLFHIEQKVPYIPDFSDAWTILKVLLVSFLLCVIYTFSQVDHASDFYLKFIPNIQIFSPYIICQLLLLILMSRFIKKLKPTKAILLILLLNFISVYFVHSIISRTFIDFFSDIDAMLSQFFVSFGILFFFLIYFDWREKNMDPANTMAKLIFLQAKMRPHFLFNTLNSIISLMKKDPDTARKMLLNLSELLRASLKEEEVSMYSFKEEINLCKKYLDIEKIRLADRLQVNWQVDESVLTSQIPRLTLQPLIENSVLHGIQHLEKGGGININIQSTSNEKIIIEMKNPIGKKISYSEDNHNNISMTNLRERLKIYYNGEVEFKAYERNNQFYILLIIPKKEKNEIDSYKVI